MQPNLISTQCQCAYLFLSYDITVIQWITYVINDVMTTHYITLSAETSNNNATIP